MPEDQAQQSAQVGSQQPASGVAASTQDQAAQPVTGASSVEPKIREFLGSLNNNELSDYGKWVRSATSEAFEEQNSKFQKRLTDAEKRASKAERTATELADEETRSAYTVGVDLMDTFRLLADTFRIPGTRYISRPADLLEAVREHISAASPGSQGEQAQGQIADPIEAAVAKQLQQYGFRPQGNGASREPLLSTQGGSGLGAADADRDFLVRFGNGQIPMTKENIARMNALTGADKPLIQQ